MKKIKYFLFLFLYLILETVYLKNIQVFNIIPNIKIILIVLVGLLGGTKTGSYVGLFLGMYEDIMFSEVIGLSALIYMYIGYVAGNISKKINPENTIFVVMTVAISDLVHGILIFAYFYMSQQGSNIALHIMGTYIPEMIYTVLMTFVVLKLKTIADKYIIF